MAVGKAEAGKGKVEVVDKVDGWWERGCVVVWRRSAMVRSVLCRCRRVGMRKVWKTWRVNWKNGGELVNG